MNGKKLLKIVIVIGVLLTVIITSIVIFKKIKKENVESILSINTPIIIEENEKYGLVSIDGEKIIDPTYDYIDQFYGDYAVATFADEDGFVFESNIIDVNGEIKVSNIEYLPSFYEKYNIWIIDGKIYDVDLNQVTSDDININIYNSANGVFDFYNDVKNTHGIIDYTGKIIYEDGSNDSAIISFSPNTRYTFLKRTMYVAVGKNIVNAETGKKVYEMCDDCTLAAQSENGIFKIENKLDNSYRFIFIYDDKVEYETDKAKSVELSNYNTLKIEYGYNYDPNNVNVTYEEYEFESKEKHEIEYTQELVEYEYGFYPETKNKMGIKKDNKLVVDYKYDNYQTLDLEIYNYIKSKQKQSLVLMYKVNDAYLIDVNNGKIKKEFNDVKIETLKQNGIFIEVEKDNSILVYNMLNDEERTFNDIELDFGRNYFIEVLPSGVKNYYNYNFEKVYTSDK